MRIVFWITIWNNLLFGNVLVKLTPSRCNEDALSNERALFSNNPLSPDINKELAYIFNVVKGSHLPKDSNPEKRTNWSKMTVFDVKKGSQEKVTGIFVKICSSWLSRKNISWLCGCLRLKVGELYFLKPCINIIRTTWLILQFLTGLFILTLYIPLLKVLQCIW